MNLKAVNTRVYYTWMQTTLKHVCIATKLISMKKMKEFNYNLNYKRLKFKPNDKRYRIGRGEQGVLLVGAYTDDICKYWKFKTLDSI